MKRVTNSKKLDWENHNFLENLFVCCLTESLSVPAESGVKFHLSSVDNSSALCLLFHIDRPTDPLVPQIEGPRPDYVAFYVTSSILICTIIEMKGKDKKNLSHGIDQIRSFRDRLKTEITNHLPVTLKVKFQGVLLSAFNSDIPREKILKENKNGLTILAPQDSHCADLSYFVTRELTLTDRPVKAKKTGQRHEFNVIEKILIFGDATASANGNIRPRSKGSREGVFIKYKIDEKAHSLLSANRTNCSIMINGPRPAIGKWLQKAGFLKCRNISLKTL